MKDYSEHLLDAPRKGKSKRLRPAALVIVPLAAILFQTYVTRFSDHLAYLELPLLVTLHFALSGHHPIRSVFYGAAIGLTQDSLSHQPIGLFGIVKTLVGYFASSVSSRFDVENPLISFVLCLFFYFFHEFFYWVLQRALLGQAVGFNLQQTGIYGLLNAAVAVPLFKLLDKLKVAAE